MHSINLYILFFVHNTITSITFIIIVSSKMTKNTSLTIFMVVLVIGMLYTSIFIKYSVFLHIFLFDGFLFITLIFL